MDRKKFFVSALVLFVLAALVYLQVRTWRKFDWQKFGAETQHTRITYLLAGVALIYADYFLRAVRWKILLRPVHKTTASRLLAPTMIGFTGLALLGRPGEFIRPYLIARKENLRVTSQVGVWLVERIFDMGAFGLIMAINILWAARSLRQLPGFTDNPSRMIGKVQVSSFAMFEISGIALLCIVALLALFAFVIRKNPAGAARVLESLLRPISGKLAKAVSHRVHAFGEGLNTVQDMRSFLQLTGLSLLIWLIIGVAYITVTHSYRAHRLSELTLSSVLLLTAASVLGGVLQLPVVGGGSQLATIGMLRGVFHASPELATSCGIMLWLVTFMSVVPAGLFLAHREHVSLTGLEKQSQVIGSAGHRVV
jgi:glycosyltransferase 2 family protein